MAGPRRNIIMVVARNGFSSQRALKHEVESLNSILYKTESTEQFCQSHELVLRNKITSRLEKIADALRNDELRPFRFLICKN